MQSFADKDDIWRVQCGKVLGVPMRVVCTCSYFVQFLHAALLVNNFDCKAEGGKVCFSPLNFIVALTFLN